MPTSKPNGSRKNHTVLIVLLSALGGCALLCCGVGAVFLPPAIQAAREVRARQRAAENLRQIGQALHNYHQTYAGQMPADGMTVPLQYAENQENAALDPEFPVVEGEYQITPEWSVALPGKFNVGDEEGTPGTVIWRPGFTIRLSVMDNVKNESKEVRLKSVRERSSMSQSFDVEEVSDEDLLRLAYWLYEQPDKQRVAAFSAVVFGSSGDVHFAIDFDNEDDKELARQIWLSIKEKPATTTDSSK